MSDSRIPFDEQSFKERVRKRLKGLTHAKRQQHYFTYTSECLYFRKKYRITQTGFETLQFIYSCNKPVSFDCIYKNQSGIYRAAQGKVSTLLDRGLIERINRKYTVSTLFLSELAALS